MKNGIKFLLYALSQPTYPQQNWGKLEGTFKSIPLLLAKIYILASMFVCRFVCLSVCLSVCLLVCQFCQA